MAPRRTHTTTTLFNGFGDNATSEWHAVSSRTTGPMSTQERVSLGVVDESRDELAKRSLAP